MSATRSLPLSAQELQESVRLCRRVDAARLDRILRLDNRRALLEVQANARWHAVADCLRPGDAQVQRLLAAHATVGATLCRNAAGPDGRPAVAHVESLTLVTPDGHLRRIDRLTSGGLFALTLGGLGSFGVLYSATLRVESLLRAVREPQRPEGLAGDPARRLRLLVPPERLESFLADARSHCAEWRGVLEGVQVRQTHDEDETFLRWAKRQYAEVTLWLGERPTLGGAVRCTQLRRDLHRVPVQTFLVGRPELRQRVRTSCHLGPLEREESHRYIEHRLKQVGWKGEPPFDGEALALIHSCTGGIPRHINRLCARALTGIFVAEHGRVGAAALKRLIQAL